MVDKRLIHEIGHAGAYCRKVQPSESDELPMIFLHCSVHPPKKENKLVNSKYTIPVYYCSFDEFQKYANKEKINFDKDNCHAFCASPKLNENSDESKKIQVYISKAGYRARQKRSIPFWLFCAFMAFAISIVLFNRLYYVLIPVIVLGLLAIIFIPSIYGYGKRNNPISNSDADKVHYLKKNDFSKFYDIFPNYYEQVKKYAEILDKQIEQDKHTTDINTQKAFNDLMYILLFYNRN